MVEMSLHTPDFDNIPGNWLCLDFTHTLHDRFNAQRHDLLNRYSDLLAWALNIHILKEDEVQQLLKIAEQHPQEASKILHEAVRLREAIYSVYCAIAESSTPQQQDMVLLNTHLAHAMSHACIVSQENSFSWDWHENSDTDRLQRISWQVVRSAADLLTSDKLRDVRACAAEDCRWLFLDISKNHSRRWCDMQTCGNQAKARRHYNRQHERV